MELGYQVLHSTQPKSSYVELHKKVGYWNFESIEALNANKVLLRGFFEADNGNECRSLFVFIAYGDTVTEIAEEIILYLI